jgi:FKBP-type peptidyl-prolyl cis-trans isomerase
LRYLPNNLWFRVSGKMTLVILHELGDSDRAIGKIPANSTLMINVELVDVNLEAKPETK